MTRTLSKARPALAALLAVLALVAPARAEVGRPPIQIRSGIAELVGPIYARTYLACDGVTDDRQAFKELVEPGGAGCGKTILFDAQCTMLWSSCASDDSDCAVATLCPGTRLVAEPGVEPNVKLAARVCVGGNTPGAACPNVDGDCNGGTCQYDTGSLAFAHTSSATYTLLLAPSNDACTGLGTPWACCYGSAVGVCDEIPQGIAVEGLRIDVRQVEPYNRCTNGGAEDGKACLGYCTGADSNILILSCDEDADCTFFGGTCVNAALCPGTVAFSSECDSAPLSPAGDGAINVIDFSGSAGVTVRDVVVYDHKKGKGILVGPGSTVEGNALTASRTTHGAVPLQVFTTYAVTHGIEAARGSTVKSNRTRATTAGITITDAAGRSFDTQGVTEVSGNSVDAAGTSCTGISSASPSTSISANTVTATGTGCTGILLNAANGRVSRNQVTATGDYVWAIRGTSSSSDSTYDSNTISVGGPSHKEGVGMEIAGSFSTASNNTVDGTQTTNSVGYRSNTLACDNWPECANGASVSFSGNVYDMDGNSNGVELFGFGSSWSGGGGVLDTGQHISFGQQPQHSVEGGVYRSGSIGAGPTVKTVCDGGANDGRLCTDGDDCPGGTCDAASGIINWTMTDAVFYLVRSVGVYCPTGCHVHDVRATWFAGANSCGIMLGDDRSGSPAGGSVHTVISGVTLHRGQSDFTGICHAGGEVKNNVISDLVCLQGTCVDLATNVTASSDISNNVFDSITCASTVGTCFSFPLLNQDRVSGNTIGDIASNATTHFSNWTPAQARRPVDQVFLGTATQLGTGATCYIGMGTQTSSCPGASAIVPWTAPADGTLGLLHCTVDTAPGGTNSRTFDVQVNGADATNHGCVISGSSTTCSNDTTATNVSAGDTVRIEVSRSGAAATGAGCTLEFHKNP